MALNAVIIRFSSEFNYFIDFGYTACTRAIASNLVHDITSKFPALAGFLTTLAGFLINLTAGLIFFITGYLVSLKNTAAYYAGIIIYLLDGLILIYTQEFTSLATYGFVLYLVYRGFQAYEDLRKQPSLATVALMKRKAKRNNLTGEAEE